MTQIIDVRWQKRRGTAAALAAANEVLLSGETCRETDTGREKTGDGTTHYNDLDYSNPGPSKVDGLADGDTMIWDASLGLFVPGMAGAAINAGAGIEIDTASDGSKTISSTVGAIALTDRVDTYADLPSGLGSGDAGKAYLVDADQLIYVWNGMVFPAQGAGYSGIANPYSYLYSEPNFSQVSSLLHFDGTDGSTTITDEVAGNVWTSYGDVHLSDEWSAFGSTSLKVSANTYSCIGMPTNSGFDVGEGDWSIEFRIKRIGASTASARIFQSRNGDIYPGLGVNFTNADGRLYFYSSTTGSSFAIQDLITTLDLSEHAVLIQRSGDLITGAVDGSIVYTRTLAPGYSCFYSPSDSIIIGGQFTGTSRSMNAYIDEFRFTKGHAPLSAVVDYKVPGQFPDS